MQNSVQKTQNHTPKAWWNDEINKLYKRKKSHLIEYFRNQTYENLMKFKKAQAKLKQTIRKESKKSWNNLIESINPDMNQRNLWNTVRRISGSFPSKENIQLLIEANLAHEFMKLNFPEENTNIEYTPINTDDKL